MAHGFGDPTPLGIHLCVHLCVKFEKRCVSGKFGFHICVENLKTQHHLTYKSIVYWARKDAPEEYAKIRKESVDALMYDAIGQPTHYGFAKILHAMYHDIFVCAGIEKRIWYIFRQHRWVLMDSAVYLSQSIMEDLYDMYSEIQKKKIAARAQIPEPGNFEQLGDIDRILAKERADKLEEINDEISKISEICSKLRDVRYVDCIIKACMNIFYDERFMELLDENKYLLCFNNGVVDFSVKNATDIFRPGMPEDYVSKSTGIDYTPYDADKHSAVTEQLNKFMGQLFPDEKLKQYMWESFASMLIGGNTQQTFGFYVGKGANGKSLVVDTLGKIMGEYAKPLPLQLLTSKRAAVGGTNTELLELKGARLAIAQENEKDVVLNEGVFKEMTGGTDKVQCRGLYQAKSTVYVPQFKPILCTNNLPIIQSNDNGTWRRPRVVPFKSRFIEKPNPSPESPFEYKVDYTMGEKLDQWKHVFMGILVKIAYSTQGKVVDCDIVLSASNEYRSSQDQISEFVNEFIEKSDNPKQVLTQSELIEEYRKWFLGNYGNRLPASYTKDLAEFVNNRYWKKQGRGWKGLSIRVDEEEDFVEDD